MSKEFKSLRAFTTHLKHVLENYPKREKALLDITGRFVTKIAKSYIGHLQDTWPELAEATKEEKERLGYGNASNDWQPLLREGDLRDSIGYFVSPHKVHVGSVSEIMIYQELGTNRIPPRPVLGLAMYKEKIKIQKALGNFLISWICDTRAQGKIE